MHINSFKTSPLGFKASYICTSYKYAKQYPDIFFINDKSRSKDKDHFAVVESLNDSNLAQIYSQILRDNKVPHFLVHKSFQDKPNNINENSLGKHPDNNIGCYKVDEDINELISKVEKNENRKETKDCMKSQNNEPDKEFEQIKKLCLELARWNFF